MSIVSTRIGRNDKQGDDNWTVFEYFTDHLKVEHVRPMIFVPDAEGGVNAKAVMEARVPAMNAKLRKWERRRVERGVKEGIDPAIVVADILARGHLTRRQTLRPIVQTFMDMEANPRTVRAAEWIRDNVTNAVLDTDFNQATRDRIRTRITDLIAMKADLEADEARQEVIE